MPGQTVRIDETEFPLSSGNPFEFAGVHSGTDLSGVQMDITVYSDVDARHIEDLIKKDKVTVDWPKGGRNIGFDHEQRAQSEMILALYARYESLVESLIENGQG